MRALKRLKSLLAAPRTIVLHPSCSLTPCPKEVISVCCCKLLYFQPISCHWVLPSCRHHTHISSALGIFSLMSLKLIDRDANVNRYLNFFWYYFWLKRNWTVPFFFWITWHRTCPDGVINGFKLIFNNNCWKLAQ